MLLIAETEKQVESIKSGESIFPTTKNRKLLTVETEISDEADRIEPGIDFSAITLKAKSSSIEISEVVCKEVNVAKAIMAAEDILGQEAQEPSEDSVEDGCILGENMRVEFRLKSSRACRGKFLLEIRQPGTYSFRTLEFLKGISKDKAELN